MKKLMFIVMLLVFAVVSSTYAAATKTQNIQALEWTSILNAEGATGVVQSAEIDTSTAFSTTVFIDWCLAEAAAHDGTEIIVLIASGASDDDMWTKYLTLKSNAVTPIGLAFAGTEAIGQTVLSTADPAGGLDHPGKFIFIEHDTPASCEIAYQVTDNASNTITVLDGISHEQTVATSDIWSVDVANGAGTASAVNQWAIAIPDSVSRVKVIFNNWFDTTGANGYGRVRATHLTALN